MKRIIAIGLAIACVCLGGCGVKEQVPEKLTAENLKIGVICVTSREQESGEGLAYGTQAIAACKGMGISTGQLIIKTDIPYSNGAYAEEAVKDCIDRGCALIFGTAAGYADTMRALAERFPRVTFVQVGAPETTLPNYHTFCLRTYQGAYLCGMAAAIQSTAAKLGIVAPHNAEQAEMCSLINAFALGAKAINAKAEIMAVFTDKEQSVVAETNAVKTLDVAGCDVLLQLTKQDTVATIAADAGMKVCSVYTLPDGKDARICGAQPHLKEVFVESIQNLLDGEPVTFANSYRGFAESALQYALDNTDQDKQFEEPLQAVKKMMQAGTWDVFSGTALTVKGANVTTAPAAVNSTAGTIAVAAGTPLDDTAIASMHWLADAVSVLTAN